MMAGPRTVMIRRVNWWWYLVPVLPILALGYAALMAWLPSWALLIAVFAFFMWLFSLLFTAYAVLMRRSKEPRQ
jgi:energy-converting hydrogenase Eha subunit A